MDGFDSIDTQLEIHQEALFYSDIFRLKIICNNLLSNAIKYRSSQVEQSCITIKAKVFEDKAVLEFIDNGKGIAQNKVDKIFDMFYRASEASTGSGLGLYIVKEVVETLKGTIQVQSQLGGGTNFIVTLPNRAIP